jgi:hypothetical protein
MWAWVNKERARVFYQHASEVCGCRVQRCIGCHMYSTAVWRQLADWHWHWHWHWLLHRRLRPHMPCCLTAILHGALGHWRSGLAARQWPQLKMIKHRQPPPNPPHPHHPGRPDGPRMRTQRADVLAARSHFRIAEIAGWCFPRAPRSSSPRVARRRELREAGRSSACRVVFSWPIARLDPAVSLLVELLRERSLAAARSQLWPFWGSVEPAEPGRPKRAVGASRRQVDAVVLGTSRNAHLRARHLALIKLLHHTACRPPPCSAS